MELFILLEVCFRATFVSGSQNTILSFREIGVDATFELIAFIEAFGVPINVTNTVWMKAIDLLCYFLSFLVADSKQNNLSAMRGYTLTSNQMTDQCSISQ
eukprot:657599_1